MSITTGLNDMLGFRAGNRRWLFIIIVPVACAVFYLAYGYLKTALKITWYSSTYGFYETLDEAINDHLYRRKELYLDPQDVLIRKKRDQHASFIWYVEFKNRATLTDSDPTNNIWLPGKYFILTKNGWLEYPMSKLTSPADLSYWMELFNLYGVEHELIQ